MLNFIVIYKICKITRISFFVTHCTYKYIMINAVATTDNEYKYLSPSEIK